jgi:hypothetical protein
MSGTIEASRMGERLRLSSRATPFWKHGFPLLWSVGIGAMTAAAWSGLLEGDWPRGALWALTGLWAGLSTFFFAWSRQLRDVWVDGDHLLFPGAGRDVRIPLAEVEEIKESRFQRVKVFEIRFRRETPLGRKVLVPSPFALQAPFSTHPVLRAVLDRHPHLSDSPSGPGTRARRLTP